MACPLMKAEIIFAAAWATRRSVRCPRAAAGEPRPAAAAASFRRRTAAQRARQEIAAHGHPTDTATLHDTVDEKVNVDRVRTRESACTSLCVNREVARHQKLQRHTSHHLLSIEFQNVECTKFGFDGQKRCPIARMGQPAKRSVTGTRSVELSDCDPLSRRPLLALLLSAYSADGGSVRESTH